MFPKYLSGKNLKGLCIFKDFVYFWILSRILNRISFLKTIQTYKGKQRFLISIKTRSENLTWCLVTFIALWTLLDELPSSHKTWIISFGNLNLCQFFDSSMQSFNTRFYSDQSIIGYTVGILVLNKGTRGFTSNTSLIPKKDL